MMGSVEPCFVALFFCLLLFRGQRGPPQCVEDSGLRTKTPFEFSQVMQCNT